VTKPGSDRGTENSTGIKSPPASVAAIVCHLGPGLIIAGSIVGSGELIATTKTGAEAGFWLLWLILFGCVVKVFAQVEFGRFSVTTGQSTMEGLAQVPGPRIPGRGNWIVWYWFVMFLASISQLGGIVGGVGQALAISMPLTQEGRDFNEFVDMKTQLSWRRAALERSEALGLAESGNEVVAELRATVSDLTREVEQADQKWIRRIGEQRFSELGGRPPAPRDDRIWATIMAAITAVLLVLGRYRLIQLFSTAMVAIFTLLTILNLVLLQSHTVWSVSLRDLVQGMSFRLPPMEHAFGTSGVATALATFGIIGVGAAELVAYPYWCLEKGYARFTGPRDKSAEWAERARGWMRVMRWDAWGSMFVYTFSTLAFYLLGAAVLGRIGLDPQKSDMVRTLVVMYEPVFGPQAQSLFLFGAFAVLYSTYFVANAGHARVFSDALKVLGLASESPEAQRRRVRFFSGLFPTLCLVIYVAVPAPAFLILLGGLMQAIMLPMLALAALFFRYRRCDERIRPGRVWDYFLWISAIGMTVAGLWALFDKLAG
jgi:Mn2+/Fe2+ NRAMP family transporter